MRSSVFLLLQGVLICTFGRVALFLRSTFGYFVVPSQNSTLVLYFWVCWSAGFNLPLPVPLAFSSKGSRIVVPLSFQVCWCAAFNLPLPVSFAFYSEGSRPVVALYFGIWASVIHSTTAGSACLFHRRQPNSRRIVLSGLFAIG